MLPSHYLRWLHENIQDCQSWILGVLKPPIDSSTCFIEFRIIRCLFFSIAGKTSSLWTKSTSGKRGWNFDVTQPRSRSRYMSDFHTHPNHMIHFNSVYRQFSSNLAHPHRLNIGNAIEEAGRQLTHVTGGAHCLVNISSANICCYIGTDSQKSERVKIMEIILLNLVV